MNFHHKLTHALNEDTNKTFSRHGYTVTYSPPDPYDIEAFPDEPLHAVAISKEDPNLWHDGIEDWLDNYGGTEWFFHTQEEAHQLYQQIATVMSR